MSFEQPILVWLALILALSGAATHLFQEVRRRKALESMASRHRFDALVSGYSRVRRGLKAGIYLVALCSCLLALAGPSIPGRSQWKERDAELVLVVDLARSMSADDVYPSRFERALMEVEAALSNIDGLRLGVVAFAEGSMHMALSRDHGPAFSLLHELRPSDLSGRAGMGRGLAHAACTLGAELSGCAGLLGRSDGGELLDGRAWRPLDRGAAGTGAERKRALLVVSDGGGEPVPEAVVDALSGAGIELVVLGVGSREGATLSPRQEGEPVLRTALASAELTALADRAKGSYLELGRGSFDRRRLVEELRAATQGELEEVVVEGRRQVYDIFALLGALALFLLSFIPESPRRRPWRTR